MNVLMDNEDVCVLLLEDNPAQYALLSAYLEKENFTVLLADCIKAFSSLIKKEKPDLVLLDLNLPDGDGLQLVHAIRFEYRIPLIIVTSRDTMMDRVAGLEQGADDYICKPYHPRELLIRINKLLGNMSSDTSTKLQKIRINDFFFDEDSHCFFDRNGDDINLTPGEYIIMTKLLEGHGRVLSRSQLLNAAFNRIEFPSERTIDVLISRLRKKFPINPGESNIIETVKGFGYRLNTATLK